MHFVKYFYCKKNLLALAPEQEYFSILAPAPCKFKLIFLASTTLAPKPNYVYIYAVAHPEIIKGEWQLK